MGRICALLALALGTGLPGCARVPAPAPAARPVSAFPIAVDLASVGSHPLRARSGGGYFFDEVLEYRVWYPRPAGGDGFHAFATYEEALAFSRQTTRAEKPLVLVRQREWIDEPKPGEFLRKSGERVTEWQVEWLHDSVRTPDSIERFLAAHAPR